MLGSDNPVQSVGSVLLCAVVGLLILDIEARPLGHGTGAGCSSDPQAGAAAQTKEALAHALASGCPIVVALTKCDLPGAQPARVRRELLAEGLELEEAGETFRHAPAARAKILVVQRWGSGSPLCSSCTDARRRGPVSAAVGGDKPPSPSGCRHTPLADIG